MATNYLMNTGGDMENIQYLSPHLEHDANPGGFGTYDSDNDGNPIDSTPIILPGGGTKDEAKIHGNTENIFDGNGDLINGGVIENAYMVYYEDDDHLGTSDFSHLIYSQT